MWPNPQFPADLVTYTEEILNEKLHFLSSVWSCWCNICCVWKWVIDWHFLKIGSHRHFLLLVKEKSNSYIWPSWFLFNIRHNCKRSSGKCDLSVFTTTYSQPLYVTVFIPFKDQWRRILLTFYIETKMKTIDKTIAFIDLTL